MERMTKEINQLKLRLEHMELKAAIVETRNRLRIATEIEQEALKGRAANTKAKK